MIHPSGVTSRGWMDRLGGWGWYFVALSDVGMGWVWDGYLRGRLGRRGGLDGRPWAGKGGGRGRCGLVPRSSRPDNLCLGGLGLGLRFDLVGLVVRSDYRTYLGIYHTGTSL